MDYLDHIDENKTVLESTLLDKDATRIGREAPADIILESKAVSRDHGCIFHIGPFLCYQDFGSTNGSWVNGEKLPAQKRVLLRQGDVLQLGNVLTRIRRESPHDLPCLIVLGDGVYLGDHPIVSSGTVLIVGEGNEYYPFTGGSVHFSCRRAELCMLPKGGDFSATQNGVRVNEEKTLSDRDEIRFGTYSILVNVPDLRGKNVTDSRSKGIPERPEQIEEGATSPFSQRTPREGSAGGTASGFGRRESRDEGGTDVDGTLLSGIYVGENDTTISTYTSRDTRRTVDDASGGYSHKEFEQKVIFGVGSFLLLVLLILFVWWILV